MKIVSYPFLGQASFVRRSRKLLEYLRLPVGYSTPINYTIQLFPERQ